MIVPGLCSGSSVGCLSSMGGKLDKSFYLYDLLMTTTVVQDAAAQVVVYLWVFLNVGATTYPDH